MSDNSGASQFPDLLRGAVLHYTGEHVAAASTAKTITANGQPEIKLLMNRTHPITGRGLIDTGRYYRLS